MRGFTAGAFDLLHAGHVLFLKDCKKNCDYLIVGLHVDPSIERPGKNKPIQSVIEREIQLRACRYVDAVIIYQTEADLEIILNNSDIEVRFLGDDYLKDDGSQVTSPDTVPIQYIPRKHPYSSTELRGRIKNG